ncbi:MAG: hypothetical protein KC643_25155 [Nitrospira sp.]|nr:hypothetical protein [Nitrospira sp.]
MVAYDESILQAEEEILLLNIARAYFHEPPHFTQTSSIQANFSFKSTAGLSHQLFSKGFNNNITTLTLGAEVSESPSITLSPSRGKEFVKHFYDPLDRETLISILTTGGRKLSDLLNLAAGSFVWEKGEERQLLKNDLSYDPATHQRFPSHFSHIVNMVHCLANKGSLDLAYPTIPEVLPDHQLAPMVNTDYLKILDAGYRWGKNPEDETKLILVKEKKGPPVINNVMGAISHETVKALLIPAQDNPDPSMLIFLVLHENEVAKSCDRENQWAEGWEKIQGRFRLRNLNEIIKYLGEGIEKRIDDYNNIPLIVKVGKEEPSSFSHLVEYKDQNFWIPYKSDTQNDFRNQDAFTLLYQLSQRILGEEKITPPQQVLTVN